MVFPHGKPDVNARLTISSSLWGSESSVQPWCFEVVQRFTQIPLTMSASVVHACMRVCVCVCVCAAHVHV